MGKVALDMVQADIFGSYFLEIKNLYFPKISSTSFLKFSFPLIPLTHGIWHRGVPQIHSSASIDDPMPSQNDTTMSGGPFIRALKLPIKPLKEGSGTVRHSPSARCCPCPLHCCPGHWFPHESVLNSKTPVAICLRWHRTSSSDVSSGSPWRPWRSCSLASCRHCEVTAAVVRPRPLPLSSSWPVSWSPWATLCSWPR